MKNPAQVHRLHLSVAELLCASLADVVLPDMRGTGHAWPAEGSILERARHVWTQHFAVDSEGDRDDLRSLLAELQNMEGPVRTASLPLTQVVCQPPRSQVG